MNELEVGQIDEPNDVGQGSRDVLQDEEVVDVLCLKKDTIGIRRHENAFRKAGGKFDADDLVIISRRFSAGIRPEQRLIAADGHEPAQRSLLRHEERSPRDVFADSLSEVVYGKLVVQAVLYRQRCLILRLHQRPSDPVRDKDLERDVLVLFDLGGDAHLHPRCLWTPAGMGRYLIRLPWTPAASSFSEAGLE